MTTDIHGLDRYIGQYVSISEGTEGCAGWLVDVSDNVNYLNGEAFRHVTFDWGQGWPVRETSEITRAEAPSGENAPDVKNPIKVMHQAMHAGTECSDQATCPLVAQAYNALRALRVWRMKQADRYWIHHYVDKVQAFRGDPVSVGEILRDARSEGAPPHILERIQAIANEANQGA